MQNIYLFITITKKSDSQEFWEFYLKHKATPIYSSICHGSANSETLNILGLERSEKVFMQSIVTENKMHELKSALIREMAIDLPDRGIAFSVPLSSIASKKTLDHIVGDSINNAPEHHEYFERKIEMELLISICTKGNSDEIMKAARAAGATGGTIIKAKGTAPEGTQTFFGMTISNEKEIIYIVTKKELRNNIMKAVASYTDEYNAHPIVFSLPVTETAGFRVLD